jgi:hypothetical protein
MDIDCWNASAKQTAAYSHEIRVEGHAVFLRRRGFEVQARLARQLEIAAELGTDQRDRAYNLSTCKQIVAYGCTVKDNVTFRCKFCESHVARDVRALGR